MSSQKVNDILKDADGIWGTVVRVIGQDNIFEYNANLEFPSASIAKIPIALYIFYLVDLGKADLEQYYEISNKFYLEGSGVIKYLKPGLKLTLLDIINLMLITSDNTAAKFLVNTFGPSNINTYLKSLGLKITQLKIDVDKFGYGMTTPNEMVLLLDGIYNSTFLSKKYSQILMSIMKNSQSDLEIRRYLPHDRYDDQKKLEIANKGGSIPGVRNDVGIVFTSKPYIIVVLSKDLKDKSYKPDNAGVLTIAKISQEIYEDLK